MIERFVCKHQGIMNTDKYTWYRTRLLEAYNGGRSVTFKEIFGYLLQWYILRPIAKRQYLIALLFALGFPIAVITNYVIVTRSINNHKPQFTDGAPIPTFNEEV